MQETWRERAKRAMKKRTSQEKVAEAIGISQPGLSHWLNGRAHPTIEEIFELADVLGVSRVWLVHGLGYESGPGKELLDLLMTSQLDEGALQLLADTAARFASPAAETKTTEAPTSTTPRPARGQRAA